MNEGVGKPNDKTSVLTKRFDMIEMSSIERLKKSMLCVGRGISSGYVIKIEGRNDNNTELFEMKLS